MNDEVTLNPKFRRRFTVKKRPIGTDPVYPWSVYDRIKEMVCHISRNKEGASIAARKLNRDYGYLKPQNPPASL